MSADRPYISVLGMAFVLPEATLPIVVTCPSSTSTLDGMSDARTYAGSCHCGKVRYEVTLDLGKVTACNCSMCGKKGTLLTFAPEEAFRLLGGEGALTSYQFNKKVIDHNFCSTCGVTSFARGKRPTDGAPLVAVNVRCLDGVDIATLEIRHFDGKSL